jgi:hypothetical protein
MLTASPVEGAEPGAREWNAAAVPGYELIGLVFRTRGPRDRWPHRRPRFSD